MNFSSLCRLLLVVAVTPILLSLGACATQREKLTRVEHQEQLEFSEKLTYNYTGAFGSPWWQLIALPGIYVAERQDADGVYFYGTGRCIVRNSEIFRDGPELHFGGFYLPNDKSKAVSFIYTFENTTTTTKDLDNYMMERTVATTATPALRPAGAGVGANIVGNAVAGAAIAGVLQAYEGSITPFSIGKKEISDAVRAARRPVVAPMVDQAAPAVQK